MKKVIVQMQMQMQMQEQMKACQRLALRKTQTYIEVISSDVGENPVTVSVASSIVPVPSLTK